MSEVHQNPEPRPELVRQMRMLALRGASVKEIIDAVRAGHGYPENAVIPVLWYFTRAFSLRLPVVLPLREWLGDDRDDEIDASIRSAIASTRAQWAPPDGEYNGLVQSSVEDPGLTAADHRS